MRTLFGSLNFNFNRHFFDKRKTNQKWTLMFQESFIFSYHLTRCVSKVVCSIALLGVCSRPWNDTTEQRDIVKKEKIDDNQHLENKQTHPLWLSEYFPINLFLIRNVTPLLETTGNRQTRWDNLMAEDGLYAFIIYSKKAIELPWGISNCCIKWVTIVKWFAEINCKRWKPICELSGKAD